MSRFCSELAVFGSAEAVDLAQSFNRLSARLKVLFDLLERLQEGSDLRQVLAFLSSEFQHLLRTDWIGVLFVTGDAQTIKLEAAYLDGEPEIAGKHLFPLRETLLAQALDAAKPLHIADLDRTASDHPTYVFLRQLRDKGMRDAILLPLDEHAHSPIRGILVFASRNAESYDREHLQLLNNIGELVTHSFGRTVKLAEHARLAAIGEFASGIVHELRSPLATIGMALDHFGGLELSASSAKRAELAAAEAARTARLLDDILLYARPMQLNMLPLDLADFSVQMSETYRGLAEQHGKRLEIRPGAAAPVIADRDRLAQVWLNLTRNALEAAPAGSAITWQLLDNRERDAVEMQIDNPGAVIPPEQLERLTEPFFTTKSGGTGLGLAIVKRIVDAHGGELEIRSQVAGTRVTVSLPRSGN